MATSSILGGDLPPNEPKGTGVDSLGPSDSSDSGSDAAGTEDRASSEGGLEEATNADILPDRVGVFPDAASEVATSPEDPEAASAADLADTDDEPEDEEND
jgi:hypothetical protein